MWLLMSFYSLTNDCVHPGRVAFGNLEARQSASFDDEVIHTKFDILGFHLLQREKDETVYEMLEMRF